MKLKVKKDFSWAHRGIDVVTYQAGDDIDTEDEDLIKVATGEGWAAKSGGGKKDANPDKKSDGQGDDPGGDKTKGDTLTE